MGTWEYRLVKRVYYNELLELNESIIEIEEVYYDDEDNIVAYGDASIPFGETIEEVRKRLDYMQKALDKPVINFNKEELDERCIDFKSK